MSKHDATQPPGRFPLRALALGTLLCGFLILVLAEQWLGQSYLARRRDWHQERQRVVKADRAAEQRLRKIHDSRVTQATGEDPPWEGTVQALRLGPEDRIKSTVTYRDPVTGGRTMLHHFDGRWVGVSPAASRPSSAPRPPRGYELLSGARRLAYIGGYVAWGLIFLAAWVEVPPRWRQSAPTLLVIAVLSTILALVGPRSWRAWSTLADEDAGLCGIIATAVSLALLVSTRVVLPARQARTGGAKRCTSCRYDLTGNVTGICPECGTPVAEVAGASS